MSEQSPYWRPKFIQSAFVQVTGAWALFMSLIDGGTYVALSTLALAVYSGTTVYENKVMKE